MSSPKYNKSILNLYNNEEKVLTKGFTPLANTIHLYKDELGLTWKEIGLITSVLASVFQNKPIVKDKDLSPDGKAENIKRDFRRQRNSLKLKGYLETTIIKDYDNGFRTRGIKYDFSSLWIKIKELVERDEALNGNIEKSKENSHNKNITANDTYSGQKSNNFLQEYKELHKKIVGTEVNIEHQKEYLLKHYKSRNRELSEIDVSDIKEAYELICLENKKRNKSLAFQDMAGGLLLIASENKTTRRKPKVKTADEMLAEHQAKNKDNKIINDDLDL